MSCALPDAAALLLASAHLRNGGTKAGLAAGFGIGVSTAWRYCREATTLLAAAAQDLAAAMRRMSFALPTTSRTIPATTAVTA